jgi:hypothetical protein
VSGQSLIAPNGVKNAYNTTKFVINLAAWTALYVPAALGPSHTSTLPLAGVGIRPKASPELVVRVVATLAKNVLTSKSCSMRTTASALDISFIGNSQSGGCAVA